MSEIKNPIGRWEIVKIGDGHGVYEKGWGFVAIHSKSCHAHWNEGQAVRRALINAAPELLEALRELLECCVLEKTDGVDEDRIDAAEDAARVVIIKAIGSQS